MIIATAGHVDHGKTTLVQALTGVDTDRLPEERRRGMTIDLGFAYAQADASGNGEAGATLAFVDVPGHERFMRNMLAGVAAVDLGLLVVAADDGPMPQTREHLAILGLLAVPRLVVALTKTDRVTPQRQADARCEVQALLAEGPHAGAPTFPVVAPAGTGVAALLQHLASLAAGLPPRHAGGHFRFAVDRSFLVAGAGRIVTGTVLSGQVRVGDAVVVSPRGVTLRVRGLQAHHRQADAASAGLRCALNLTGPELRHADPERGDWIVAGPAHAPTNRLDVQLQVLASEARPLSPRAELQLHLGAAALAARVLALGDTRLAPGSTGFAQLVLQQPVQAAWGDRFILRDAAANRVVAGGWVVDPVGLARGRSRPARRQQLSAMACSDPADALALLLDQAPDGVDLQHFARARNLTPDETTCLCAAGSLVVLPTAAGPLGLSTHHQLGWRQRVLAALDRWHADQPASAGPQLAALSRLLALSAGGSAARAVLHATLAGLVADGLVTRQGLVHRRHGHQPRLDEADRILLARVQALLRPAGLRPPIVGELATQLALPLAGLREFLARMAAQGQLVAVAPNRWYLPETVDQLVAHALALAGESADGGCDAAAYRDRTGIGRNLTVQVLEFLDRAGITRFDGRLHRPLEPRT